MSRLLAGLVRPTSRGHQLKYYQTNYLRERESESRFDLSKAENSFQEKPLGPGYILSRRICNIK